MIFISVLLWFIYSRFVWPFYHYFNWLLGLKQSYDYINTLQWRQNGVSNHQPQHCLLNCLFRLRSQKTSKLRVTGLWAGNSRGTGEFPAQMASNAENVSIWWHHHELPCWLDFDYNTQSFQLAMLWKPSVLFTICENYTWNTSMLFTANWSLWLCYLCTFYLYWIVAWNLKMK